MFYSNENQSLRQPHPPESSRDPLSAKLKEEERWQRKTLHFMCCPKCGMELIEIEYKGVKIDKCSDCAGVWLDCGEMERILDQEQSFLAGMLGIFRRKTDSLSWTRVPAARVSTRTS